MTSVVSAGTTDRIAARTLLKVARAGCGTAVRYSSTVLGLALLNLAPFFDADFPRDAVFFIRE